MKTIKLFGDLEKFKKEWLLDVTTPGEALRAIEANRPGFIEATKNGEYAVVLVDYNNTDLIRQVTLETCSLPWHTEELWVVPVVQGEIVAAGAAIVIAGVSIGVGSAVAAVVLAIVLNLALSIAISMLTTLISGSTDAMSASQQEIPESRPSYLVNGAVNTSRQGHRIPLLYGGPLLVGSMVLASDIHVKDIPV